MKERDLEFIEGLSAKIWDRPNDKKRFVEAIDEAWANKDEEKMREIFGDLTQEQQLEIWSVFREFSKKRAEIKQMLGVK